MCYNPFLFLFILMLMLSEIWPVKVPSWWLHCSFEIDTSVFESVLTVLQKMFQNDLYFLCLALETAISPKDPDSFLGYLEIKVQMVCVLITTGMTPLASISRNPEIHVGIYMHIHIHAHTYLELFICLSTHIKNQEVRL